MRVTLKTDLVNGSWHGGVEKITVQNGNRQYHIASDGGEGICVYAERSGEDREATLFITDGRGLTYSGLEEIFIEEHVVQNEDCCH